MKSLLLDTNIVSYLMKNDPLARLYRPRLVDHALAISFMTVAELYEGAFRGNWGAPKRRYLDEIDGSFVVIPSDTKLCARWGEVRWMRRHQPISADDAWIAATAIEYDCPLVTHNARDFHSIPGLRIITETGWRAHLVRRGCVGDRSAYAEERWPLRLYLLSEGVRPCCPRSRVGSRREPAESKRR